MRIHSKDCLSTLFVLCLLAPDAYASAGSSLDDYAGTWEMKLGQRDFLVIKLKNEGGRVTGTLSLPKEFQTSSGVSFSHISSSVRTEIVATGSLERGCLHFTVQNPGHKGEENDYEMTLNGENQASLKLIGVPFDSWTINRAPSNREPKVATDWDVNRSYTLQEDSDVPNAEPARIFEEDQEPRSIRAK